MSKLTIVRDALAANPEVLIIGIEQRTYLPNPSGRWTHTVNIVIAPRTGIYDSDKLQSFMMGLVKLEPSCMDSFHSWTPSEMHFGKLYFDEVIGTGTTTQRIAITDPDVPLPDNFVNGALIINEGGTVSDDLRRQTWVQVYPDREFAERAMAGLDEYFSDDMPVPLEPERTLGIWARLKAAFSNK